MSYNAYTGIGSRETPDDAILQMREFAFHAAEIGWVLRSGGADGADSAFEDGCDDASGKKEIFLPWKGFNHNDSPLYPASDEAYKIATGVHPNWRGLREPARLLVARNMHQVMGQDMKQPSRCVVCWTKDGCENHKKYTRNTGGTGSAISLASLNNIPVFNIANKGRYHDAVAFLLDHLYD